MVFGQPYEIQFRFMGQRYIPDSEIMQRLVKSFERAFPKGLDVMAVFGSRVAKELMLTRYKEDWKDFPKYPQELEKLTEEFKKLKPEEWKKNLYYNWLWCLKSLLQLSKEYKYPFFMNNDAYLTKSLNSALASWTELRHDTILYAKQSYCAECGGEVKEVFEWIPKPPKGYVEPNIEFYKRMEELLIFSRDKLKKYNALGGFKDLFERFIEVVAFLKNISTKEIDNRPLTLKEYEQIRRFGSLLDNLTLSILEVESDYPADWGSIEGPDKRISLVVDVHTAPNRDIHGNFPGPGAVLEEAVGDAFEIYVIVEIDGRLKLTRGAVFSYYEFKWPMDDRLTDEKWQEILEKGKEPPLPDWIDVYFSKSPKKLPKPAYIPTMEVQEKIGKEQPGWYMIYYETGS
ncbi:TPA: hypothetical protein DCX15_05185 [bacterium]|nr:hypothetical protein [bacterium]